MPDPLTTGGAAGGGTILGAVLAFFGFKGKLGDLDKRLDRLTAEVQFKSTCVARHNGVDKQFENVNEKIDNVHTDVKEILRKI